MEQEGTYTVKTSHFQGPLGLLLDLIEKRKLFISDISLSSVADDFISYISSLERFPIAESAQFILIASTLLLIKSKSLLPTLDLTEEEQSSIHDLEERLRLYKQIKDLSVHVKDRFGKNFIFEKNPPKTVQVVFSPDASMTIPALAGAIKGVLANLPKKEHLPNVTVKKVISLEEVIESLTARIQSSLRMNFRDFAKANLSSQGSGEAREEKITVIVSFLAMLELVKQGIVMVSQEKDFEDIEIQSQNVDVPRYASM